MGIFFKSSSKEEKPENKAKSSAPLPSNPSPVMMTQVVVTGDSTKYDADFDQVMKECNIPGPDYFEFMQAINNPALAALPEQQRYIATFAPISAMGVTKDKLLETASMYITKLNEQSDVFVRKLARARKEKVEDKQAETEQLRKENEELTLKMQENIKKIGDLSAEVNQNTLQLNTSETSFNMALKKKTDMIQSHITNIKTFLQ